MTRKVELGMLAHETLPLIDDRSGAEPADAVAVALRYFFDDGAEGLGPVAANLRSGVSPAVPVELRIEAEIWEAVEAQAREEQASPDAIVTSAVLAYVAALEAGRLHERAADLAAPRLAAGTAG